jgi:signal transduction histidine kinase
MKKRILILICFCCVICLCYGQNKQVDSLLQVLKTAKEDTAKVNTVIVLAYKFADKNPDTTVYFANKALALATKLNYKFGITDAHLVIGSGLTNLGKYEEALKNFNEALTLCDELLTSASAAYKSKILKREGNAYNNIGRVNVNQGNYPEGLKNSSTGLKILQEIGDKRGITKAYNLIGNNYYFMGNYPEALKNYFAAVKIAEETGDNPKLAGLYNNIGIIYDEQSNYPEALKNYFAALKIDEKLGNKRGNPLTLMNIGITYKNQGNPTEALKNYFAALKLFEEVGDKYGEAMDLNNIGVAYGSQCNHAEALKNYFASLKIAEEIGDKDQMANRFNNIGVEYINLNKSIEASRYLNKGLSLAKEIGSLNEIKNCYLHLADLDSAQGNFKLAFENHKMYITYRDSLINKETTKKTIQIQMQYEFDKKESLAKAGQEEKDALALKELQKQKLLRNFSIGAIGLVVVLFLFVYRIYRARQLLRLNDIRNKIAGDLHDDIGSTLNSISIYSEVAKKKGENYDEALEMIGDASRKVIEAMSDIVWTINAENDSFEKIIFRMTSHAYNLFHARNIEFTFHADEILNEKKLSLEERRNFYLIFKEAVNNLVKYSKATHASIDLTNENNLIRLRIRDDGIGFDTSKENTGNGLKNMKRRADEMKAEFKIESQTGNGTQIDLILKA